MAEAVLSPPGQGRPPELAENFQFYVRFAKPLVLNLAAPNERVLAAAWVQKLCDPTSGDERVRTDYLKLLLFVMQKGRLFGPFVHNPTSVVLEDLGMGLRDVAKSWLETEESLKRRRFMLGLSAEYPPVSAECSGDLTEYAAAQDIPNFGVHAYYAFSHDPITDWDNTEKGIFPKGALSAVKKSESMGAVSEHTRRSRSKSKEKSIEAMMMRRSRSKSKTRSRSTSRSGAFSAGDMTDPSSRKVTFQPSEKERISFVSDTRPLVRSSSPLGSPMPQEDRTPPTWGSNLISVSDPPPADETLEAAIEPREEETSDSRQISAYSLPYRTPSAASDRDPSESYVPPGERAIERTPEEAAGPPPRIASARAYRPRLKVRRGYDSAPRLKYDRWGLPVRDLTPQPPPRRLKFVDEAPSLPYLTPPRYREEAPSLPYQTPPRYYEEAPSLPYLTPPRYREEAPSLPYLTPPRYYEEAPSLPYRTPPRYREEAPSLPYLTPEARRRQEEEEALDSSAEFARLEAELGAAPPAEAADDAMRRIEEQYRQLYPQEYGEAPSLPYLTPPGRREVDPEEAAATAGLGIAPPAPAARGRRLPRLVWPLMAKADAQYEEMLRSSREAAAAAAAEADTTADFERLEAELGIAPPAPAARGTLPRPVWKLMAKADAQYDELLRSSPEAAAEADTTAEFERMEAELGIASPTPAARGRLSRPVWELMAKADAQYDELLRSSPEAAAAAEADTTAEFERLEAELGIAPPPPAARGRLPRPVWKLMAKADAQYDELLRSSPEAAAAAAAVEADTTAEFERMEAELGIAPPPAPAARGRLSRPVWELMAKADAQYDELLRSSPEAAAAVAAPPPMDPEEAELAEFERLEREAGAVPKRRKKPKVDPRRARERRLEMKRIAKVAEEQMEELRKPPPKPKWRPKPKPKVTDKAIEDTIKKGTAAVSGKGKAIAKDAMRKLSKSVQPRRTLEQMYADQDAAFPGRASDVPRTPPIFSRVAEIQRGPGRRTRYSLEDFGLPPGEKFTPGPATMRRVAALSPRLDERERDKLARLAVRFPSFSGRESEQLIGDDDVDLYDDEYLLTPSPRDRQLRRTLEESVAGAHGAADDLPAVGGVPLTTPTKAPLPIRVVEPDDLWLGGEAAPGYLTPEGTSPVSPVVEKQRASLTVTPEFLRLRRAADERRTSERPPPVALPPAVGEIYERHLPPEPPRPKTPEPPPPAAPATEPKRRAAPAKTPARARARSARAPPRTAAAARAPPKTPLARGRPVKEPPKSRGLKGARAREQRAKAEAKSLETPKRAPTPPAVVAEPPPKEPTPKKKLTIEEKVTQMHDQFKDLYRNLVDEDPSMAPCFEPPPAPPPPPSAAPPPPCARPPSPFVSPRTPPPEERAWHPTVFDYDTPVSPDWESGPEGALVFSPDDAIASTPVSAGPAFGSPDEDLLMSTGPPLEVTDYESPPAVTADEREEFVGASVSPSLQTSLRSHEYTEGFMDPRRPRMAAAIVRTGQIDRRVRRKSLPPPVATIVEGPTPPKTPPGRASMPPWPPEADKVTAEEADMFRRAFAEPEQRAMFERVYDLVRQPMWWTRKVSAGTFAEPSAAAAAPQDLLGAEAPPLVADEDLPELSPYEPPPEGYPYDFRDWRPSAGLEGAKLAAVLAGQEEQLGALPMPAVMAPAGEMEPATPDDSFERAELEAYREAEEEARRAGLEVEERPAYVMRTPPTIDDLEPFDPDRLPTVFDYATAFSPTIDSEYFADDEFAPTPPHFLTGPGAPKGSVVISPDQGDVDQMQLVSDMMSASPPEFHESMVVHPGSRRTRGFRVRRRSMPMVPARVPEDAEPESYLPDPMVERRRRFRELMRESPMQYLAARGVVSRGMRGAEGYVHGPLEEAVTPVSASTRGTPDAATPGTRGRPRRIDLDAEEPRLSPGPPLVALGAYATLEGSRLASPISAGRYEARTGPASARATPRRIDFEAPAPSPSPARRVPIGYEHAPEYLQDLALAQEAAGMVPEGLPEELMGTAMPTTYAAPASLIDAVTPTAMRMPRPISPHERYCVAGTPPELRARIQRRRAEAAGRTFVMPPTAWFRGDHGELLQRTVPVQFAESPEEEAPPAEEEEYFVPEDLATAAPFLFGAEGYVPVSPPRTPPRPPSPFKLKAGPAKQFGPAAVRYRPPPRAPSPEPVPEPSPLPDTVPAALRDLADQQYLLLADSPEEVRPPPVAAVPAALQALADQQYQLLMGSPEEVRPRSPAEVRPPPVAAVPAAWPRGPEQVRRRVAAVPAAIRALADRQYRPPTGGPEEVRRPPVAAVPAVRPRSPEEVRPPPVAAAPAALQALADQQYQLLMGSPEEVRPVPPVAAVPAAIRALADQQYQLLMGSPEEVRRPPVAAVPGALRALADRQYLALLEGAERPAPAVAITTPPHQRIRTPPARRFATPPTRLASPASAATPPPVILRTPPRTPEVFRTAGDVSIYDDEEPELLPATPPPPPSPMSRLRTTLLEAPGGIPRRDVYVITGKTAGGRTVRMRRRSGGPPLGTIRQEITPPRPPPPPPPMQSVPTRAARAPSPPRRPPSPAAPHGPPTWDEHLESLVSDIPEETSQMPDWILEMFAKTEPADLAWEEAVAAGAGRSFGDISSVPEAVDVATYRSPPPGTPSPRGSSSPERPTPPMPRLRYSSVDDVSPPDEYEEYPDDGSPPCLPCSGGLSLQDISPLMYEEEEEEGEEGEEEAYEPVAAFVTPHRPIPVLSSPEQLKQRLRRHVYTKHMGDTEHYYRDRTLQELAQRSPVMLPAVDEREFSPDEPPPRSPTAVIAIPGRYSPTLEALRGDPFAHYVAEEDEIYAGDSPPLEGTPPEEDLYDYAYGRAPPEDAYEYAAFGDDDVADEEVTLPAYYSPEELTPEEEAAAAAEEEYAEERTPEWARGLSPGEPGWSPAAAAPPLVPVSAATLFAEDSPEGPSPTFIERVSGHEIEPPLAPFRAERARPGLRTLREVREPRADEWAPPEMWPAVIARTPQAARAAPPQRPRLATPFARRTAAPPPAVTVTVPSPVAESPPWLGEDEAVAGFAGLDVPVVCTGPCTSILDTSDIPADAPETEDFAWLDR